MKIYKRINIILSILVLLTGLILGAINLGEVIEGPFISQVSKMFVGAESIMIVFLSLIIICILWIIFGFVKFAKHLKDKTR